MLTDRGDDGDVVLSIGWIKKGVKPPSPRRDLCERKRGGVKDKQHNHSIGTSVLVHTYVLYDTIGHTLLFHGFPKSSE